MHETAGLVPQAFYDLISRIVPGAVIILAGAVLLTGDSPIEGFEALRVGLDEGSSLMVLLGALLASYFVGALLGAFSAFNEDREFLRRCGEPPPAASIRHWILGRIGFWRAGDVALRDCLSRIKPEKPQTEVISDANLAYVYDFIQMRDAAAGGRLAKLRAEVRMCRVLRLGTLILILLYLLTSLPLSSVGEWVEVGLTVGCLLVIAIGCYLLDVHLAIRSRRLMVNCWNILQQNEVRLAAPYGHSIQQPGGDPARDAG